MSDAQKFRTMDWLIGVATTVALAIGGWSLQRQIELSERMVRIESTQFTPATAESIIAPKLELIATHLQTLARDIEEIKTENRELREELRKRQ